MRMQWECNVNAMWMQCGCYNINITTLLQANQFTYHSHHITNTYQPIWLWFPIYIFYISWKFSLYLQWTWIICTKTVFFLHFIILSISFPNSLLLLLVKENILIIIWWNGKNEKKKKEEKREFTKTTFLIWYDDTFVSFRSFSQTSIRQTMWWHMLLYYIL
jgi:hypothetical protein